MKNNTIPEGKAAVKTLPKRCRNLAARRALPPLVANTQDYTLTEPGLAQEMERVQRNAAISLKNKV
jgi:hypothetical protein